MVVISASVCNKQGKILFARQFVGINRLKLEEYVANFPKLIESGNSHASRHSRPPVYPLSLSCLIDSV